MSSNREGNESEAEEKEIGVLRVMVLKSGRSSVENEEEIWNKLLTIDVDRSDIRNPSPLSDCNQHSSREKLSRTIIGKRERETKKYRLNFNRPRTGYPVLPRRFFLKFKTARTEII